MAGTCEWLWTEHVKALSTIGALGNQCGVLSINCHQLHVTAFLWSFSWALYAVGAFCCELFEDSLWDGQGVGGDGFEYFVYDGMKNLSVLCWYEILLFDVGMEYIEL